MFIRLVGNVQNVLGAKTFKAIYKVCSAPHITAMWSAAGSLGCSPTSLKNFLERLSIIYFGDENFLNLDYLKSTEPEKIRQIFAAIYKRKLNEFVIPVSSVPLSNLEMSIFKHTSGGVAGLLGFNTEKDRRKFETEVNERLAKARTLELTQNTNTILAVEFWQSLPVTSSAPSHVSPHAPAHDQNTPSPREACEGRTSESTQPTTHPTPHSTNFKIFSFNKKNRFYEEPMEKLYQVLTSGKISPELTKNQLRCSYKTLEIFFNRLCFYYYKDLESISLKSFKENYKRYHELFTELKDKKVSDIVIDFNEYPLEKLQELYNKYKLIKLADFLNVTEKDLGEEFVRLGVVVETADIERYLQPRIVFKKPRSNTVQRFLGNLSTSMSTSQMISTMSQAEHDLPAEMDSTTLSAGADEETMFGAVSDLSIALADSETPYFFEGELLPLDEEDLHQENPFATTLTKEFNTATFFQPNIQRDDQDDINDYLELDNPFFATTQWEHESVELFSMTQERQGQKRKEYVSEFLSQTHDVQKKQKFEL